MWKFLIKRGGLLLSLFVFAVCQPMHYAHLESASQADLSDMENQDLGEKIPSRSGEKEFKETFVSDKLDLVFVLDTKPEMAPFYQTELFGTTFLDRFQKYDWRLAYTDMSVDITIFAQSQEEEKHQKAVKKDSCSFFSGLIMTTGGFMTGQPLISSFGINNLFNCAGRALSSNKKKKKPIFTNGSFLPFEHKGKKWDQGKSLFLTSSTPNYKEIFHHTMKPGSGGKKAAYDPPIQKDLKAYPFLSMILSMAKEGGIQNPQQSSKEKSFFRKDSVIKYVLITSSDFQTKIEPEYFKDSVKSFFGSEKRLQIIPVTVKSDAALVCQMKFKQTPLPDKSSKMEDFVKEINSSSVLNICSQNLAEELFKEISKSLYPTGFLND